MNKKTEPIGNIYIIVFLSCHKIDHFVLPESTLIFISILLLFCISVQIKRQQRNLNLVIRCHSCNCEFSYIWSLVCNTFNFRDDKIDVNSFSFFHSVNISETCETKLFFVIYFVEILLNFTFIVCHFEISNA